VGPFIQALGQLVDPVAHTPGNELGGAGHRPVRRAL